MAVVSTELSKMNIVAATAAPWAYNASTASAADAETIIVAPGAGKNLYVTKLTVVCDANITVTLGSGAADNAVEATLWGPIPFGTAGGVVEFAHPGGVQLVTNKTLTVDASDTGNLCIIVEGYTV